MRAHDPTNHGRLSCSASAFKPVARITLDRAAFYAWQVRDMVVALGSGGALAVLSLSSGIDHVPKSMLSIAVGLCLGSSLFELGMLNALRFRRYAIEVYHERLMLSRGWVAQEVIVIPRVNVLSLRMRQGPVLRRLGLTTTTLITVADRYHLGPLTEAQRALVQRFVGGDLTVERP